MIYLLEDDESIRKFVLYALESTGMEASGYERPSQFWKAVDSEVPELVLLDIMLPEEDGLSVLKRLRERPQTAKVPVIMLTAKAGEYDKVVGLDGGADDYITKPFGTMELLSRIRALLRRTQEGRRIQAYTVGALTLNPQKHTVIADGQDVVLTYKEFALLNLMMANPGVVFTREQLLQKIWGYEYDGENRTVDVHIKMLRTKLGACGALVETVRGVGYRVGDGR